MKHLFAYWSLVKREMGDKDILLLLDYDGTLSPIADTPEQAIPSAAVVGVLRQLSMSPRCSLAIITGRALRDIQTLIGLDGIVYSGNHGLEIAGPGIHYEPSVPPGYTMMLQCLCDRLRERISSFPGVFVEDKGLSLSLHYRLADPVAIPRLERIFYDTAAPYLANNQVKVKPGKLVWEIRPATGWDKREVVLWLLARQVFATKHGSVYPIYIGDDATDEDAFSALRNGGLTVLVGESEESHARYCVKSPEDVLDLLKKILELAQGGPRKREKVSERF
jgi:trehalose-phosphatase